MDKLLSLEKAVEVSEVERKQLLDEIANLKQTLESKEKAHNLHIRAYQDGHDRQEDQIAMLEARVRILVASHQKDHQTMWVLLVFEVSSVSRKILGNGQDSEGKTAHSGRN